MIPRQAETRHARSALVSRILCTTGVSLSVSERLELASEMAELYNAVTAAENRATVAQNENRRLTEENNFLLRFIEELT